MHKLIKSKYLEISNIYCKDTPDFLLPFFEAIVINRLSDISQHCGTEHCKFYDYNICISRLEHSLGVATIIWNFTKNKKQTLAGFFHDISHSVFSHVGDFVLGDAVNQESSEKYTSTLLKNDKIIMSELSKLDIKLSEVDDYEIYPIADNPSPGLAADRLEYTLSSAIALNSRTLEEIKEIYDDIIILVNEKGVPEIGFKNLKLAKKLGILSVENDESCFSSYESTVAMSFLSEIVKEVLKQSLVTNMQLYTLKDNEIIDIIENSNNSKTKKMWNFYKELGIYKTNKIKPKTNKYFVSSNCKRRYIDPLVQTEDGNIRLSKLSKEFCERKDYHINRKEEWITLDFEM